MTGTGQIDSQEKQNNRQTGKQDKPTIGPTKLERQARRMRQERERVTLPLGWASPLKKYPHYLDLLQKAKKKNL